MVCKSVRDVLMHGYSIFKRRNNEIERKKRIHQLKDGNTFIIVLEPQEKEKKSLKRLLQLTCKKPQIIGPSVTQVLYWGSLPKDSDSMFIDNNSYWIDGGLTVHALCISMASTDCSIRSRSSETLQEQIASLQAKLTEFQRNEFEYRTISDEYQHFMLEQEAEIEKKELKIMQLKQMVEMIAFKDSPEDSQKSDGLQTSLLYCTNLGFVLSADHGPHIVKTQGIKGKKSQQRELQQQKRVYATLILQSQAATQKLQETIAAFASHVKSLKAQLEVLASELKGLQILQIKVLIEELDTIIERYQLASTRIDEKSQLNQGRWSKWEKIIFD